MPQTDVLIVGVKSISVVLVFSSFLLHFFYFNLPHITTLFKTIIEFSKAIIMYVIIKNFKDAATQSRTHMTTSFIKKIC